jgi:hypothetical protein
LTAYSLPQIQDWPPEQWLIHGIVPKGELTLLYGPSRIGKSFVIIDMLMSLATGRQFAGIDVESVPVLYIVTEGALGLPKRFKAWEVKNGGAGGNLVVVAGKVDLFSERGCKTLARFIRDIEKLTGLDFGLIVIDTLAKAMGKAKENDNSDVTTVTLNAQQIGELFAATILLVHHTGKSEDAGPRGGSAFTGNVNASIAVTKGSNGERFLELDKMKDEDDSLRFAFTLPRMVLGTNAKGREITSLVAQVERLVAKPSVAQPRRSVEAEKLLALVVAAGPAGLLWADVGRHPEFAVQWNKRRATVSGWRAELQEAGDIRLTGPERKTRLFATCFPLDEPEFGAACRRRS